MATAKRLNLLKALRKQHHRYNALRAIAQTFSLAVLVLVPLSGLARVDFWAGRHYLLFEPASFRHALAGVIVGIVAMYVVTFLSNVAAGRLFCGWGCPVGQVSRFGEALDTARLKPWARRRRAVYGALFSGVFVVSVLAWWVDLRVLISGEPAAMAITWGLIAVGTAGAFLHGRYWQWSFCKNVCPIGLYYSVVSPARYYGVHFRNEQETCIECDACDHVCPVDLKPRDLHASMTERRGLSVTDAPGRNHCLECGDCIRACEFMIDLRGHDPVPLKLGWFTGPQRVEHGDNQDVNDDADTCGHAGEREGDESGSTRLLHR